MGAPEGEFVRALFAAAVVLLMSAQAQALCIINLSPDTVAYSRGGPGPGMETFFTGVVTPGQQICTKITPRMDGTYPVSIYTIANRGSCAVVRGCLYETLNEQILFYGRESSSCPTSFQDNSCS